MILVRPARTASMMKENTSRGLSSLAESVSTVLKYIWNTQGHLKVNTSQRANWWWWWWHGGVTASTGPQFTHSQHLHSYKIKCQSKTVSLFPGTLKQDYSRRESLALSGGSKYLINLIFFLLSRGHNYILNICTENIHVVLKNAFVYIFFFLFFVFCFCSVSLALAPIAWWW